MRELLFAAVGLGFMAGPICRYTVRDIGFVSLIDAEWSVEAVGPIEAQAELRAMESLLLDANVTAQVQPSNDLAVRWSLIGSDGLRLGLGQATGTAEDIVAVRNRSLSAVLNSPLRQQLGASMLDVFATVLLVAGTDERGVAQADREIQEAIKLLHKIEPDLPRPLAGDVVVHTLKADNRIRERVALWALGLSDLDPAQSAVVLLYGRMKRAGAPLVGERLITAEILTALALIGESCECDTDRNWAGEPRLPHRFDAQQHAEAAATLGFDPASPYVLAEVTRILSRGSSERPGTRAIADLGSVLFGYREGGISGLEAAPVPAETAQAAPVITTTSGGAGDWGFDDDPEASSTTPAESSPIPDPSGLAFAPLILIGFLVLCVLVAGGILIVSRKS